MLFVKTKVSVCLGALTRARDFVPHHILIMMYNSIRLWFCHILFTVVKYGAVLVSVYLTDSRNCKVERVEWLLFRIIIPDLLIYYMVWNGILLSKNFWFLSDEGPMLETLDYTIRIGSIPTFLYFDLYLYSAYAAHFVYSIQMGLIQCLNLYKMFILII